MENSWFVGLNHFYIYCHIYIDQYTSYEFKVYYNLCMLCYYTHIKKYEKNLEAAAETSRFHEVTPLVTFTCLKLVLWVHGIASRQHLCSLLRKTREVFMESVNTDKKDKLLIFRMVHHTCQNSKHKYLFLIIQEFLTAIFFTSIHITLEIGYHFQTSIDTHVNWLSMTSYNRMKGHIIWIKVYLDNDYLLIY